MFKYINQCDVYVGLWCIYMLQDVLYPAGIINQFLQLIMLVLSIIAVFKYLFEYRIYVYSSILKATFLLLVMYTVYGGMHIMFGDSRFHGEYVYLQNSVNSLAPIFLFYNSAMKGKLTSDRIRVYLPILIVTCIILYYKKEGLMILITNKEEVTNNAGYYFVSLIPLLLYYRRPILQYVFLGIILLFIFMSMKRGAIFIGVLSTTVLLYANLKDSSRWKKFLVAMLSIVIIVGTIKYIDYMMSNSNYFVARFEQTMEGDSSGRNHIYRKISDTILLESRPLYFIFGRGAESTVAVSGGFAHQDWLETFCNNGLIGVIILFVFFYAFGKTMWQSRKYFPLIMYYSFLVLFINIFCKTIFSMSIQNLQLADSMLLGYFAFEYSNFNENYG